MARTSILDGMEVAALQSRLAAMQQAYLDLSSGAKIASASYTQGDGSKSVSYTAADMGRLVQSIITVQAQIDRLTGQRTNRRAPIRAFF